MMRISIDTSLLAHALITTQRTDEAVDAFDEARHERHELLGSSGVFVEFPSIIRKSVARRAITTAEAQEILEEFLALELRPIAITETLV